MKHQKQIAASAAKNSRYTRKLVIAIAMLTLAGCASFSNDGGFASVQSTAKDFLGKEVAWAKTAAERDTLARRVNELLAKPLTVDDAIQVALLNNRGLQASFAELGIAEADVVQAGRLANPGFRFARLKRGGEIERESGIHLNLARLIMMPQLTQMEQRRFAQTQRMVAMDVLTLAADTRKAYYMALAADESVRYTVQVKQAADAGAELARRMAQVGNFNKLEQAREQAFYADATLNLARTEQMRNATREKLTRLMGLWGQQIAFTLPERLPDLPKAAEDQPDIEQQAMTTRLDVQAARLGAEQLAKNLGLTRTTHFINVLELGAVRNTSNEQPTQRGYEISLELPLFDWGGSKVAKAEAVYMQALDRAAETAVNARSEVREAYLNYRTSYDIARHYRDEIVPIRKRIADENVLRYNGMLMGVFELLADSRAQIASVNSAIEALRDFWLARADLDMALAGKPSISAAPQTKMMGGSNAPAH